jgi:hypothetical protein
MSVASWFEFEPDEARPENVAEFLKALRDEAANWLDADPFASNVYDSLDGYVMLGLDVSDLEERCVLRSLRADYSSRGLECGEDETNQFTTALSSHCAEYIAVLDQDLSPAHLAHAAAHWFWMQMIRPVECLVWRDGNYRLRQWRLADTKRALCWSASDNTVRADLGEPQISLVRTLSTRLDVSPSAQQAVAADRAKPRSG